MNKRNKDPRNKGDIAEKMFELECVKNDIDIFKPINSNGRVDYIIVLEGQCKRVQIKYISEYNNRIAVSFTKNQNGRKDKDGKNLHIKYSPNEIDLFFVYCPNTNEWYDIPITLANTARCITLRTSNITSKNNQTKGVVFASDFKWSVPTGTRTQSLGIMSSALQPIKL